MRPGHHRIRRRPSHLCEWSRPPRHRLKQLVLHPQQIRQRAPLSPQRLHRAQHIPTPTGHDQVAPAAGQRGLGRRRELDPVVIADPITRPHVKQPPTAPGHREEVRDMGPPALICLKAEPHRLAQNTDQITREIQNQQQPLLGDALKTMVTARADQELQARTVPLTRPPREPANRLAPIHREGRHVTNRADHLSAVNLPHRTPATGPPIAQSQSLPFTITDDMDSRQKVRPTAPVRR